MTRNAYLEGLEAAEDEPCLKGPHRGAGHVLETEHLDLGYKLRGTDDEAGYNIAVTVEVLGRGMYDNVGSELKRSLKGGGGKGVVADDLDVPVVLMRGLCQKLDVGDLKVGVCRSFEIHGNGVLFEVGGEIFELAQVGEGNFYTVLGHAVLQQREGAAVKGLVSDDVLSGTGNGPQTGRDGAHTGGRCGAGLSTLKRCDLVFKDRGGGISETAVDIAVLLAGKAAAALFTVFEIEGRGLIDGHCQ